MNFSAETGAIPINCDLANNSNVSTLLVRTGSLVTMGCRSRYGFRDLIGNIEEWLGDRFTGCGVGVPCTGSTSSTDPNNTDLWGVALSIDDTTAFSGWGWLMANSIRMSMPLAIPAADSAPTWMHALPLGSGTNEVDPSVLAGDWYSYRDGATSGINCLGGGRDTSGGGAGRFYWQCDPRTSASAGHTPYRGVRCGAPVSQ